MQALVQWLYTRRFRRIQRGFILQPPIVFLTVDSAWYLSRNLDVRDAVASREYKNALDHYKRYGRAEGRQARPKRHENNDELSHEPNNGITLRVS